MSKPALLVLDDDREVLGAIERDLRRHYRADYRVLSAASGREGLDTVRELKRRGAPLALFLVDQRMQGTTGTEFLAEALKLYPDAAKVLLTAYADTDAAIAAINTVGVDHYLLKPWDPPEQRLYPVLDDLLASWRARTRLPFEGVRVAGSRWSPQSHAVREFLSLNQVPYQWIDVEADAPTRELIVSSHGDLSRLPVVFLRTADRSSRPRRRSWPPRSACARRPRGRFTTSSSSAAARRDWPARCTARPRACACCSSNRARPGARPARAR